MPARLALRATQRTMFEPSAILPSAYAAVSMPSMVDSPQLNWCRPGLICPSFSLATVIDQWPERRVRGSGYFFCRRFRLSPSPARSRVRQHPRSCSPSC